MRTPMPPATAHLLELFRGPLRDVRFPDADGERLASAVSEAEAAALALARAEAALDDAKRLVAETAQAAARETERTLAYVRIYAVDRPELLAALDTLTTPARPSTRRGPGRPRKAKPAEAEVAANAAE